MWTPPTSGEYSIIAAFGGSDAYYGSCAETHLGVVGAHATSTPEETPLSATMGTIILVLVVLALLIAIVGLLLLLRKH
jgi:hypothetical protein